MNRTLTATVALAAALGIAGVAHAQTPAPTMPQPMPGASTAMPNSPAVANPSTMTDPSNVNTSAARPSGVNPPAASTPPSMNPSATAANPAPAMNNNNNSFQGGSKQASMSQSDIQQAQQQLKSQGLYRGAVDGIMGPQTEQALSQFQQQNGLPQTADLDQQTMSRLMGGSSPQGMQQQPMQPQAMPQQNQAMPGSAANPLPANQAR